MLLDIVVESIKATWLITRPNSKILKNKEYK